MKTRQVSHNIFTAWNIRVHIIDLQWAVWPYTKAPTVGPLQRLVAESLWAQLELESDGSELDVICLLVCLFSREDHGRLQLTRSSLYRWSNVGKIVESTSNIDIHI